MSACSNYTPVEKATAETVYQACRKYYAEIEYRTGFEVTCPDPGWVCQAAYHAALQGELVHPRTWQEVHCRR